MNGSRTLHYFRIAFTAVCGVAAVLLAMICLFALKREIVSPAYAPYVKIKTYWQVYGCISLASGLLAVALGIGPRLRFSLCTLLITTTVVAILLGLDFYINH